MSSCTILSFVFLNNSRQHLPWCMLQFPRLKLIYGRDLMTGDNSFFFFWHVRNMWCVLYVGRKVRLPRCQFSFSPSHSALTDIFKLMSVYLHHTRLCLLEQFASAPSWMQSLKVATYVDIRQRLQHPSADPRTIMWYTRLTYFGIR